MKKFRLRNGDKVVVISGKFKKTVGEIKSIDRENDRVYLKDINVITRHTRPSLKYPDGVVEKEAPIHISNVAYYDEKSAKPSRIGYKIENGVKRRFAKKSNELI